MLEVWIARLWFGLSFTNSREKLGKRSKKKERSIKEKGGPLEFFFDFPSLITNNGRKRRQEGGGLDQRWKFPSVFLTPSLSDYFD